MNLASHILLCLGKTHSVSLAAADDATGGSRIAVALRLAVTVASGMLLRFALSYGIANSRGSFRSAHRRVVR
jgi:hypothetical protein